MSPYRLRINNDDGGPTPYSWEIYRSDEQFPVQQSGKKFRSAILAKVDGHKAMRQLQHT
jgi:hypothetical protein